MDAYVGIGTNLGRLAANLELALSGLRRVGLPPLACSSVWQTEPVDAPDPRWFWNMVVRIEASGDSVHLLDSLLALEREAGRVRTVRNGPRVLDLDLLLHGNRRLDGRRLRLPHPRMWERRFVLEPLAEIAPDLRNPASGRTVAEELERLGGDGALVRRLGPLADCPGADERAVGVGRAPGP